VQQWPNKLCSGLCLVNAWSCKQLQFTWSLSRAYTGVCGSRDSLKAKDSHMLNVSGSTLGESILQRLNTVLRGEKKWLINYLLMMSGYLIVGTV
jgi:hypothetical protein